MEARPVPPALSRSCLIILILEPAGDLQGKAHEEITSALQLKTHHPALRGTMDIKGKRTRCPSQLLALDHPDHTGRSGKTHGGPSPATQETPELDRLPRSVYRPRWVLQCYTAMLLQYFIAILLQADILPLLQDCSNIAVTFRIVSAMLQSCKTTLLQCCCNGAVPYG
ncbi:hypothetical protein EAI_09364 [Harpegnathos saltator]|uniref:Uncharacterized protein n=1 Tax=Harpegnathos saltator TaxID=610380 RepID=E2B8K6_HARSA|nr:hypothetical protein EAI_09364 [Harpegnathos saltator]